ncbi:MAG: LysM peptidoglycan-binding domain-containing protein [Myxococcales bacterium]|nr:LysM peptidoglycan-binding domain-containing protein [Myxococcales bacterium]
MTTRRSLALLVVPALLTSRGALAQNGAEGAGSSSAGQVLVGGTVGGGAPPAGGGLAPGSNLNAHLPSSAQPMVGERSSDGFDLAPRQEGGGIVTGVGGDEEAGDSLHIGTFSGYGRRPAGNAELHVVRQGDTLWDLSGHYLGNTWAWPQLWSLNPQVENPHWIYPGDQLRVRQPGAQSATATATGARALDAPLVARRSGLAEGTIFLRDQGYIGDPEEDVWGELVGSAEDQMLLSYGNQVYLLMREGVEPRLGQQLTAFLEVRQPAKVPGARRPPGEIVKIYGTIRVNQWDPETRVARGEITEAIDVIERGVKVGPVGRRFDVVPIKPAQADVVARVLASIYPHVYVAQNQVVFLDKGSEDGLEPGNRMKVVRRGDQWRRGLQNAPRTARARIRLDSPELVPSEITPIKGDDADFPDEVIGEVRILRTEKYSSVALVVESNRELLAGDRVVSAAGY